MTEFELPRASAKAGSPLMGFCAGRSADPCTRERDGPVQRREMPGGAVGRRKKGKLHCKRRNYACQYEVSPAGGIRT
jgi:hypothetical protein